MLLAKSLLYFAKPVFFTILYDTRVGLCRLTQIILQVVALHSYLSALAPYDRNSARHLGAVEEHEGINEGILLDLQENEQLKVRRFLR